MMYIDSETFKSIVKHTPLISIDLVVENNVGEILLGYRKNMPAKNTWFVPGGRIQKEELFADAFSRLTREELGSQVALPDATFLGVYEHLYPEENFAEEKGYGTHYIVLAFKFKINDASQNLPQSQHREYRWMKPKDIIFAPEIHQNVKNYFNGYTLFS